MKIIKLVLVLSVYCELTTALKRKHFYISEARNWIDAQRYCRQNYVDLSSLDTPDEFSAISTVYSQYEYSQYSWSWVGLEKISSNWHWSDGSNRDFYQWFWDQPNDPQEAFCAMIIDGWLYDNYCWKLYTFFCYNWEPELIVVRENKTWEDALQHCRTHYTDLASMSTYFHLLQANQTITNTQTASIWTGLRLLSGSWFWLNGDNLDSLVQLPTCTANRCGARNLRTHSWENRDCMEKLNFICY